MSVGVVAGAAAGGVLIVAVIVFLYIRRRRVRRYLKVSVTSPEGEEESDDEIQEYEENVVSLEKRSIFVKKVHN
jgi:hypothetical protein